MAMNPAMSRSVGVRRPVYLQGRKFDPAEIDRTTGVGYRDSRGRGTRDQLPMPSADAFQSALKQRPGALNGTIGFPWHSAMAEGSRR